MIQEYFRRTAVALLVEDSEAVLAPPKCRTGFNVNRGHQLYVQPRLDGKHHVGSALGNGQELHERRGRKQQ